MPEPVLPGALERFVPGFALFRDQERAIFLFAFGIALLASGLSSSTVGTLAGQMIEDSDNDAATSLWYAVGGAARIRSFNARAGLTQTAPSSCVVCPGFAWPGWGLTTTTPDDQIALLRQLVTPSSVLPRAAREYALSLMQDVTPAQRWGVSGGVPARGGAIRPSAEGSSRRMPR